MIGFDIDAKGGAYNVVRYRIIYELGNYLGNKYIGLTVDSPI